MSAHPSTKSSADLEEIWYVGRGRYVLRDDMMYDPIQGQGHVGPKGAKMADFKVYLLRQYASNQRLTVNYDNPRQNGNFFRTDF